MLREKESRPFSEVDKRLKAAVSFIEQNYSEDIKSADVAAAVGYHPYHLSKLFIKHLGASADAILEVAVANDAADRDALMHPAGCW